MRVNLKALNIILMTILIALVSIIVVEIKYPKTTDDTKATEITTEYATENEIPEVEDTTEITTPIPVMVGVDEYEGDYYIFCEVVEIKEDTFVVFLPNGDYEEFHMIPDPPIDDFGNPYFTIVVFKVAKHECYDFDKWVAISVG